MLKPFLIAKECINITFLGNVPVFTNTGMFQYLIPKVYLMCYPFIL